MGPHADAGGSARAARLCGGPSNTSDRGRPRNATLIYESKLLSCSLVCSAVPPGSRVLTAQFTPEEQDLNIRNSENEVIKCRFCGGCRRYMYAPP